MLKGDILMLVVGFGITLQRQQMLFHKVSYPHSIRLVFGVEIEIHRENLFIVKIEDDRHPPRGCCRSCSQKAPMPEAATGHTDRLAAQDAAAECGESSSRPAQWQRNLDSGQSLYNQVLTR